MEPQDHNKETQTPLAMHLAICIGALCIMGALMNYSYTHPYPSGKPPGLVSFAMFWLREIVILLFAVIVLVMLVVGSAVKWIRRIDRADKAGHAVEGETGGTQQTAPTTNPDCHG